MTLAKMGIGYWGLLQFALEYSYHINNHDGIQIEIEIMICDDD